MEPIKRRVEVDVYATPLELARSFCDMDGDEQAEFFNYIEHFSAEWEAPFALQMSAIEESTKLTEGGRFVMRLIGEYSDKRD